MKNLFSIALIAQVALAVLFLVHRFFQPLGSDLMFAVLIASVFTGLFLIWQSFKNSSIKGHLKILGIIVALLPLFWLLLFLFFANNSKM